MAPSLAALGTAFLACAGSVSATKFSLVETYDSTNFLDKFDFWESKFNTENPNDIDVNGGHVNYLPKASAIAAGLIRTEGGEVVLGVDHKNLANMDVGRSSVKIQSKTWYKRGLIVARFSHMPEVKCGVWPAFWTVGKNWPQDGEFDIYEGWNLNPHNAPAFHTANTTSYGKCMLDNVGAKAPLTTYNCDNEYEHTETSPVQYKDQGCVADDTTGPWGSSDGGVYALEWTHDFVKLYNWHPAQAPKNIGDSHPDTSSWGTPTMYLKSKSCNIDKHFNAQSLMLNINFCGNPAGTQFWGSSGCSAKTRQADCKSYINKFPGDFANVFFKVKDIRYFQEPQDIPKTTSTTSSSSTKTTSTSTKTTSTSTTSTSIKTTSTSTTSSTTSTPTSASSSTTSSSTSSSSTTMSSSSVESTTSTVEPTTSTVESTTTETSTAEPITETTSSVESTSETSTVETTISSAETTTVTSTAEPTSETSTTESSSTVETTSSVEQTETSTTESITETSTAEPTSESTTSESSTAEPTTETNTNTIIPTDTSSAPGTEITSSATPTTWTTSWGNSSVPTTSSVELTTSVVYTTTTYTITSCPPVVTNCPIGKVTTVTVPAYTTVCPVSAVPTTTETAEKPTGKPPGQTGPETVTTKVTKVYTITSCAPTVTNCPVGKVTTEIVTSTYCPPGSEQPTGPSGEQPTETGVVVPSGSVPTGPSQPEQTSTVIVSQPGNNNGTWSTVNKPQPTGGNVNPPAGQNPGGCNGKDCTPVVSGGARFAASALAIVGAVALFAL